MASNFCSSYATQVIYCSVFGATSGGFSGQDGSIVIDLIGLERFTLGFGLNLFSIGVAITVGPPIAGKLNDVRKCWEF